MNFIFRLGVFQKINKMVLNLQKEILSKEVSFSSNNDFITKLLKKKRVGILKNPSILQAKQEHADDIVSEQIFLLNLGKNEPIYRKKTLKNFRKDFYEDSLENNEKTMPSILKKQSSLKEILISSKKMKMAFEKRKHKYEPCLVTQFWSDKYYRSLFKHSKLDLLDKETEKERIWSFVKRNAFENQLNSAPLPQIIMNKSRDIPNPEERNVYNQEFFNHKKEKSASLHQNPGNLSEYYPENKSFMKKPSSFRSMRKDKFLEETNDSLSQLISNCDSNKKDCSIMRE